MFVFICHHQTCNTDDTIIIRNKVTQKKKKMSLSYRHTYIHLESHQLRATSPTFKREAIIYAN